MQRDVHAEPVRLAHERAGDQVDLGRPVSLDVLEHGRECALPPLRGEDVHLPRILVQLDAGRRGDALALVDQVADEVDRGRRGAPWRRSAPLCGSPVSAATALTVALKISFDHCAGRRSGSAFAFRPARSSSAAISVTSS